MIKAEIKVKFVKKANMWLRVTFLGKEWKTSKKTGQRCQVDKFNYEWFLEKPA